MKGWTAGTAADVEVCNTQQRQDADKGEIIDQHLQKITEHIRSGFQTYFNQHTCEAVLNSLDVV